MKMIRKGGRYFRVCDPVWIDCCETSFSAHFGGRWNPPDSFPVLYLNTTLETARANALRNYTGEAFGLFDLNPVERPHLQVVEVNKCSVVDAITSQGVFAIGLPTEYPKGVGHEICQPIGQRAKKEGAAGIACRSAALPDGEELALFEIVRATKGARLGFNDWFNVTALVTAP